MINLQVECLQSPNIQDSSIPQNILPSNFYKLNTRHVPRCRYLEVPFFLGVIGQPETGFSQIPNCASEILTNQFCPESNIYDAEVKILFLKS